MLFIMKITIALKPKIPDSYRDINNSIVSTIAINIHRKNGNSSIKKSQINPDSYRDGANIKELFNIIKKQ